MDKMIPFNKPYVPEASKKYVMEALESDYQQGDGPFTKRASKMVSDLVGGGHVLLTPSCTHALEMASMLGNFGPGDEVILPSYTFTSAATAVTKFGATPVFVDIDPATKGIDANQVAHAVTDKTVAISWVNYAGVAPDIEALQNIATKHNLLLIEDNAHGLGGTYRGKPLGSFGDFATQSFHATKNIQCGEGGALVINTEKFIESAEIIREKGTNRKEFIDGKIKKYEWVGKGSSYLLSELQAAVLLGQLESFEQIQSDRCNLYRTYLRELNNLNQDSNVWYKNLEIENNNVAHILYVELNEPMKREKIQAFMLKNGVQTTFHYVPLDTSPAGKKFGIQRTDNKNSSNFSKSILRFPLWMGLTHQQVKEITSLVQKAMIST
jgi:dTDP-4-amino-4,6-dideoxygalactose transaminase